MYYSKMHITKICHFDHLQVYEVGGIKHIHTVVCTAHTSVRLWSFVLTPDGNSAPIKQLFPIYLSLHFSPFLFLPFFLS